MADTNQKEITTIKVSIATKTSLDLMKIHPRQSYDEVIDNMASGSIVVKLKEGGNKD